MSPTGIQPLDENAEDLLRSAVVDQRFSSLKDLRVVHTEFLARLDTIGPDDPSLLDAVQRIHELGVATGAVLDESPERREAQSLLDFWENVLYRGGRPMNAVRLAALDEAELPALPDS